MKKSSIGLIVLAAAGVLQPSLFAAGITVLTVPWVPNTPLSPHSTYAINPATEVTVTLQATAPNAIPAHSPQVTWVFGDGSPNATFTLANPYDISVTHQYPSTAAPGTAWTATVTVTDSTNSTSGTANFYITQQANNLASRVNVAIDRGLWYLHQTMFRADAPGNGQTVNWGGWDTSCTAVNGSTYDCIGYGSINATNVQAFEVSGHLATGPATDPYTDDVMRGTARMFASLQNQANVSQTYLYNPAISNYTCSNGYPTTSNGVYPYCGTGTQIFYEPLSLSCVGPPCPVIYDSNANGQMIYSNDGSGEYIYTTGPFMDSLAASGTPNAFAPTGIAAGGGLPGIKGQTYINIMRDMADWYGACQWYDDYDLGNPLSGTYARGSYYGGGGWLYDCQQGDDNSTSQWGAIGLIGASRGSGFNISTPQTIKDFNNVWVTNSQDVQNATPTGTDPYAVGDNFGSYGYRGSFYYSNAWGPFATTPSGMVQMALDGIGRTTNTAFGNPTNAPDQRFNNAETYYADNFCNSTSSGSTAAPRAYTYGLFSFTKSMLLHDPNGSLSPIQYMRTQTPGVFPANPPNSPAAGELDWYSAVAPPNGTDPCDGVAQTLVNLQQNPPYGVNDGHWWGNDYDGDQYYYETAWSIIMLNKTVFVSCVNNLTGRGNPSGPGGAQVNLAWSAQSNATGYTVFRSSTSGGPYTQIGTTNVTGYRDGNDGLVAGNTYYYVVQPTQGTTEICQSNQATIVIP